IHKAVVKNVSACLEGEGCDQKPMPICNGWDMPTGRGMDIDTAISRILMAASLKTTCAYNSKS
ncbi:hypothetical protein B9T07_06190, partial [Limnospira fusiformis CCALA 023]